MGFKRSLLSRMGFNIYAQLSSPERMPYLGREQGHHADTIQPPELAEQDSDGQGQQHQHHRLCV